ncbi:MAG: hypothetical protein WCX97_05210, partial [Candidatus Magasanikbacteria bacterium]
AADKGDDVKTINTPRKKPERQKDDDVELVTVKQLASMYGIESKRARKLLRGLFDSADGRWEWAVGDPTLKIIHKSFREKFGEPEVD